MYRIRLRVRYQHRAMPRGVLALTLLAVGVLVSLTLSRAFAASPGSPAKTDAAVGQPGFYLSTRAAYGSEADAHCADGYHFASMWEIADPSNLRYNSSLGTTSSDSGAGPPTRHIAFPSPVTARGWVRTGYGSSTSGWAGRGNCAVWSSDAGADYGTVAHLVSDWTGVEEDVGPWNTEFMTCDSAFRVWCVQDRGLLRLFLPVVLKG